MPCPNLSPNLSLHPLTNQNISSNITLVWSQPAGKTPGLPLLLPGVILEQLAVFPLCFSAGTRPEKDLPLCFPAPYSFREKCEKRYFNSPRQPASPTRPLRVGPERSIRFFSIRVSNIPPSPFSLLPSTQFPITQSLITLSPFPFPLSLTFPDSHDINRPTLTTEYCNTLIQRGGGTGPLKPRQPDESQGANSGSIIWKMRGCVLLYLAPSYPEGVFCFPLLGGVARLAGAATRTALHR